MVCNQLADLDQGLGNQIDGDGRTVAIACKPLGDPRAGDEVARQVEIERRQRLCGTRSNSTAVPPAPNITSGPNVASSDIPMISS
jgi:hypothetical protein